jgi:hypothetical protein
MRCYRRRRMTRRYRRRRMTRRLCRRCPYRLDAIVGGEDWEGAKILPEIACQ